MYSSKIKEIWDKIHSIPIKKESVNNTNNTNIKSNKEILSIPNFDKNKDIFPFNDYHIVFDLFINKFQETSKIFSKFSHQNFFSFIYISTISVYNQDTKIFVKDEICNTYNFILQGDIELYSEENKDDIKLNSTLSSGEIYGHLIKDKYTFFAKAKNEVVILHILKTNFDYLIKDINDNIKKFKSSFIQKFFPKIRTFSGDVLIKILTYFERIKYKKHDIILNNNTFNDYIYIIISGEVGFCLEYKYNEYVILEKMSKGEIIGINSAILGIKNKCNCFILTEEAEMYRISKEDLFYYFNYGNELILDIKSIGDLQDMSIDNKINFIKNNCNNKELINKYIINIEFNPNSKEINNYIIVYEDPIDNILHQKWRMLN